MTKVIVEKVRFPWQNVKCKTSCEVTGSHKFSVRENANIFGHKPQLWQK